MASTDNTKVYQEFATFVSQTVIRIFGINVMENIVETVFTDGEVSIDKDGNIKMKKGDKLQNIKRLSSAVSKHLASNLGEEMSAQILNNLYGNLEEKYKDSPALSDIKDITEEKITENV